ncbi:4'-phosphopantetheinyl transferase family protein [Shewanella woodyi]|uniref:4'-phosphopantetheinyl transferase n=1 Tax=Shewanella woodyi (strain ATCC 51908 / MS32) TaxID=392500 RepID=B1KNW5_SHEWM|nr:4'-phosphopantetheinyl transferase superfamily protein [Shewanella woodyi]ACA87573.1 4'-phosphopantetheinyl transferase [Shewanella woodyi ATCC 51908]
MSPIPTLSPSPEVTLYFCPLATEAIGPDEAELIRSWLPEDELTKVSRYVQADARDKALVVRGYLRGILSLTRSGDVTLSPSEWQFEYGEKGKPDLITEQALLSGLKFNISHSGDWLVVAVYQGQLGLSGGERASIELGVDIERNRDSTNIYPILNHYFTQSETDELLSLPESSQRQRFFDLWALKESYIKAKGLGLALSLKSFYFDFARATKQKIEVSKLNNPAVECVLFDGIELYLVREEGDKCAADTWCLFLGRLSEEYRFAVSASHIGTFNLKAYQLTLTEMLSRLK